VKQFILGCIFMAFIGLMYFLFGALRMYQTLIQEGLLKVGGQ